MVQFSDTVCYYLSTLMVDYRKYLKSYKIEPKFSFFEDFGGQRVTKVSPKESEFLMVLWPLALMSQIQDKITLFYGNPSVQALQHETCRNIIKIWQ